MTRLLEVGRIGKPHGVRGALHITFSSDRLERRTPGATFVARTSAGDRELVVETSRPASDRWVVTFVGVTSREQAELLVNAPLLAEPIEDPDALWVHDLIGARIVDVGGLDIGTCTAVVENPAHALLETDGGDLIPVPFVVSQSDGVIVVSLPPGLLGSDDAE
ncbi:MAG: ribosome maturation factor RimM [Actinomycetota bacterium]